MRITPLDVRKQEFKRGMRGYDADEVRAFMATLADEYETVLVDNRQLRERMLELDEKLAEYRNLERTLRDTLMTAERVTQDARETARKQGELLIEGARLRVDQVMAQGRAQLDELRREALAVHREKETFLGRFHSLAEAQIQFVASHRSDFKALDGRLLDQADLATRTQVLATGPMTSAEAASGPIEAIDEGDASKNPPASVRRVDGHDQWRNYAIERTSGTPAAQVSDIADAVSHARSMATGDAVQDAAGDTVSCGANDGGPEGAADPITASAASGLSPTSSERTNEPSYAPHDEVRAAAGDATRP